MAVPLTGSSPSAADELRLQILGPLRVWRGDTELDPGPRQQAFLLATLLALEGRQVSRAEIIDLVWEDHPPATAVNVIHKYVGALRRLLEPARATRGAGSYLRPRGDGYIFLAGADTLDLVLYRRLVEAARAAVDEDRGEAALDDYAEALALWRGPAGDGLTPGSTAMPVFAALDVEFFDACVAATDLAVRLGQPERVLPALQLAASLAPLREPVQAGLVLALGAAGQQAEALSEYRAVRARLCEELGIEPGPELQAAHRRVLTQSLTLAARPDDDADPLIPGRLVTGLVGRDEELSTLRKAANAALTGGTGLVVIEGEPGVGKTRLVAEAAAEADRAGAKIVWGTCTDGAGTPALWPWTKAVTTILDMLPPEDGRRLVAGGLGRLIDSRDDHDLVASLPDRGAQFRLFEQIVAVLAEAATRWPIVLVIDDLQWADTASLQMFGHLADRLPGNTLAVVMLRDRAPAPGAELSQALAGASRVPDHRRIRLRPLNLAEVAELVRGETGQEPGDDIARGIFTRTSGNPFFVQELARLLAKGGKIADGAEIRAKVPFTVRDIVRHRTSDLDDDSKLLLQIAALAGSNVSLRLLAHAADLDVRDCLERIEPLEELGILTLDPDDQFTLRFRHDLVRESIPMIMPTWRATGLHLRIADALERGGTDDESVIERLAYHLWEAGPLADPARTAGALTRAGLRAATKAAFESAGRHLQLAVRVARKASRAEPELSALSLLIVVYRRQLLRTASMVDLLRRAEVLARELGREGQAADFLFARVVWASMHVQAEERGRLARLMLDQGDASSDPIVRARGRQAWALHQWDLGHVGEAMRYMASGEPAMLGLRTGAGEDLLQRDMRLLGAQIRALISTGHGDIGAARAILDSVRSQAGEDRYAIAIWAHFATMAAALAGDWVWARTAMEQWISADPEHSFDLVNPYLRITQQWIRALTGDDPAGAASSAEEVMAGSLLDPPLAGVPFHYGLIAEMLLAAGKPAEADAILDRAEQFLVICDQHYADGLLLLLRARVMHARGAAVAEVQAVAEAARALSAEREAYGFARRAEAFLASTGPDRHRIVPGEDTF